PARARAVSAGRIRSITVRAACGSRRVVTQPRGLLSISVSRGTAAATGRPSTATDAVAGSTLVPGSCTISPFTLTRRLAISSSASRLEATPAAARTFCNRTSIARPETEQHHDEQRPAAPPAGAGGPRGGDGASGDQRDRRLDRLAVEKAAQRPDQLIAPDRRAKIADQ